MYIIIVNPISGNGRALRVYRDLMGNSEYNHLKFKTCYTEYKGHAEEITRQLMETIDIKEITSLIVLGGDGTFHEVMNGLTHKSVPVSFIACGSGNDFARGTNITRNTMKAMKQIYPNPNTLDYWTGKYKLNNQPPRTFVNSIGFGFDAVVAKSANESRVKKVLNRFKFGTINYVIALLKVIFSYKPMDVTLELDGETKRFTRCFLATIHNHPFIGGGMKINPEAKNNEAKFSILVIDSVSKLKVIFLFATVFTGYHTRFKEVSIFEARHVVVKSKRPIPYQADGEPDMTTYCEIEKETEAVTIKGVS